MKGGSVRIGFTGTRDGMTPEQLAIFAAYMGGLTNITEFHMGDCVGADDQAANEVARLLPNVRIIAHPPQSESYRAFNAKAVASYAPKPYLMRNRDIVACSDILIATPKEEYDPGQRNAGGTWYTVRYARQMGGAVVLIRPSGALSTLGGLG